ncbi:cytochrome b-245 chaperone 1-like [Glandiceps talaboti]
MTYMKVVTKNDRILHLAREPSVRSWSIFVGILSVGLGAAYFSVDSFLWSLSYIVGCLIIAATNLEEWEDCIFDKDKQEARMKKFNLMHKILLPFREQRQVVVGLSEIVSVKVKEEEVKYTGKGFFIVLVCESGFVLPITDSCFVGDKSSHVTLCDLIKSFLKLDQTSDFGDNFGYEDDISSSDDSDDSIEEETTDDQLNSYTVQNESSENIEFESKG